VSGLSSFALFINEENTSLPGIKNPSSASNSSDFILFRILNKDYKILFSNNENRVEKFREAIKVSYFYSSDKNDCGKNEYDKRDLCEKTMNNKSAENVTHNNNTNENSDIEININHNDDNNEKLAVKKPILKSKTKSFARIPVQFQEFENVRLYKYS
jgi:hypothetical protein